MFMSVPKRKTNVSGERYIYYGGKNRFEMFIDIKMFHCNTTAESFARVYSEVLVETAREKWLQGKRLCEDGEVELNRKTRRVPMEIWPFGSRRWMNADNQEDSFREIEAESISGSFGDKSGMYWERMREIGRLNKKNNTYNGVLYPPNVTDFAGVRTGISVQSLSAKAFHIDNKAGDCRVRITVDGRRNPYLTVYSGLKFKNRAQVILAKKMLTLSYFKNHDNEAQRQFRGFFKNSALAKNNRDVYEKFMAYMKKTKARRFLLTLARRSKTVRKIESSINVIRLGAKAWRTRK